MKRIFIGQAVTGQDISALKKELGQIYLALKSRGYKPYSTLEEVEDNKFKKADNWLSHAFKIIDNHDIFLAIIRTEHRSEGLLIEIGYALSKKKKFILAINENVKNTYLRHLSDKVIEWKDFQDLLNKLSKLKIEK
ncbi:MAG: hypothetical protein AABW93_04260 [Nanoarchaeota archaeon]